MEEKKEICKNVLEKRGRKLGQTGIQWKKPHYKLYVNYAKDGKAPQYVCLGEYPSITKISEKLNLPRHAVRDHAIGRTKKKFDNIKIVKIEN